MKKTGLFSMQNAYMIPRTYEIPVMKI